MRKPWIVSLFVVLASGVCGVLLLLSNPSSLTPESQVIGAPPGATLVITCKDAFTGAGIPTTLQVHDWREYPLLSRIKQLPERLRIGRRTRHYKAADGVFVLDAGKFATKRNFGLSVSAEAKNYEDVKAEFPMNWEALTTNYYYLVLRGKSESASR